MSDLQTAIPCLRYANTDFYPQCSSYFNCGMTVIPQPPGQTLRLYTIGKQQLQGSLAQGSQVGGTSFNYDLVNLVNGQIITTPVTGTVCSVPSTGLYTISVTQANNLASLYPANSPQYVQVQISYTDSNGNPQTVQPAPLMHVSDNQQNGQLTIDCTGGTDITYTVTPYNVPQKDGIISIGINLTAGGSGSSNDDWCSKVYYQQVDYAHIERYVHANRSCGAPADSIWYVANALAAQIFGNWRVKRRYCPPTDVGFENLPPLPPGFHYPQTSTDAGGRSSGGSFAIKHGRIYIVPWIESTESVVVEWNGLKTNWADSDLVTDDPRFEKAVRLKVGIDHYLNYEDNAARLADFKRQYFGEPGAPGVLRELIIDCRNRTRVRSNWELGADDGDSAGGIGITTGTTASTGTYYSAAQSYTAQCPSGQNGQPVTMPIPAGAYSSTLSQADADAQAMAAAQSQAQAQLSCVAGGVYQNAQQTFVASCPGASGSTPAAQGASVTSTILAGSWQSTVSQALADAAALQAAQATANSQLVCKFYNAPQTVEVTCADNSTQSVTIAAGDSRFTSAISQNDADTQAQQAAQSQAANNCNASLGSFIVGNTGYSLPYNFTITTTCGQTYSISGVVLIPARAYKGQATNATAAQVIAGLNVQAMNAATLAANFQQAYYQQLYEVRCYPNQITNSGL